MLTGPHIKKLNFDRCDHKVLGTCSTQAEGCCGVVACNLCIEITSDYTGLVVDRKVAPFSSPGYAATLGVVVFEAYWRRDYTTDECVFIVEVTDAVETQVLEFSKCYDAASCMAPAGSVAIQYDGKPHVLSWEPLDIVTLKHRVEGKCKKPFCGECTCSTREICVTLTIGGCTVSELVGLEPSECKEEEPPVWEFTLVCPDGGLTVSGTVSLLREDYTNACILNVVIPAHYIDVDYEWTECPQIDDIVVPFTIGDENASVTIRSADCDMCGLTVECCEGSIVPTTLGIRMFAMGLIKVGPGQAEEDYNRIDRDGVLTYQFGNFMFEGYVPGAIFYINPSTGAVIDIDIYLQFSCGGPGADGPGEMRIVTIWQPVEGNVYSGTPAEFPDEWISEVHPDFTWGEGDLPAEGLLACMDTEFRPDANVEEDWSLAGASDPITWPRMACTCDPIAAWGSNPRGGPVLVTELDLGEVNTYPWDSIA